MEMDFVIAWVDGNDPAWQKEKRKTEHVPDYICGGIDSAPDGKTWKTIVWGTGSWFKKTVLLFGTGCVNLYEIIKKS